MWYDRSGQPIDNDQAYQLAESNTYKRVNETTLPNGLWVSTVRLGLDHRYSDEGPRSRRDCTCWVS